MSAHVLHSHGRFSIRVLACLALVLTAFLGQTHQAMAADVELWADLATLTEIRPMVWHPGRPFFYQAEGTGAYQTGDLVPELSRFRVNGVRGSDVYGWVDLKITGDDAAWYKTPEIRRISGTWYLFSVQGYLVVVFDTVGLGYNDIGYGNYGRFAIIDAGGAYSGNTGEGAISIDVRRAGDLLEIYWLLDNEV